MKKCVLVFVIGLVLFSCGSRKKIAAKKNEHKTEILNKTNKVGNKGKTHLPKIAAPITNNTVQYIMSYKDIAMEEMRLYNIPASITLAQGILESGSGRGRLAIKANNHFGIKCHNWKGDKIYHDDDKRQECFRKYNNSRESFRDRSKFLTNRKRYANLFKLKKDNYKAWAKELKRAGYATDKKYPQKLIAIIERYELYKYDKEVLGKKYKAVKINPDSPDSYRNLDITHKVVKGDTLYSLSLKYNTSVNAIKNMNNLTSNDLKIDQILIIKSN